VFGQESSVLRFTRIHETSWNSSYRANTLSLIRTLPKEKCAFTKRCCYLSEFEFSFHAAIIISYFSSRVRSIGKYLPFPEVASWVSFFHASLCHLPGNINIARLIMFTWNSFMVASICIYFQQFILSTTDASVVMQAIHFISFSKIYASESLSAFVMQCP